MSNTRRVLIVEDDTDLRRTLKDLLELEGFSVFTSCNGKEALELLKTYNYLPDLILLDLMMPIMDGSTFLHLMRREEDLISKTPVIVLSAAGIKEKLVEADGYLKKPLELDALLKIVRQYCGNP